MNKTDFLFYLHSFLWEMQGTPKIKRVKLKKKVKILKVYLEVILNRAKVSS